MIHILDLQFLDNSQTIAAFAIETNEGIVLVESGPYTTFESLEKQLQKIGFQLHDVKHVLLSHIHFDHAGAAWALAQRGANIYVHPFGYKHLENPEKLWASAKRIYGDEMERLWGEMHPISSDKLFAVQDHEELHIGGRVFKAWHTPGHANHHIAWQLDKAVFAGDVAGVQIGQGAVVPPCPPPDIDIEKWDDSIEILKKIQARYLYLTHYGQIGNVTTHLDQLSKKLHEYAAWVKIHAEAGQSLEEMVENFEHFVQEDLQKYGLDQVALQRYKAANPPFMSVTGLLRYWEKKAQEKI